ncbi:MAG: YceI family protein [Bacteroidota bacterium]
MKTKLFILLFSVILLPAAAFFSSGNWKIADDYTVAFDTGGAKGTFSGIDGDIIFDPNNLAGSSMDVSVEVATIETGNNTKNRHARGESWFDAESYPTIRFVGNDFARSGSDYKVSGDLTLHGTTKQIEIPFTFSPDGSQAGLFEGSFTVNRKDYGIDGNFWGFMVGKDVEVSLRIPVTNR